MSDNANQATMTLPMDLIKPAIEAKVNAAVIEALNGTGALIERVVHQIMTQMVDSDGKVNSYSSNNKATWLTWAVQKAVEDAVKKAIADHIAEKSEAIKESIEAELRKSKSPLVQALINGMAEGMAKVATQRYNIAVTFASRY